MTLGRWSALPLLMMVQPATLTFGLGRYVVLNPVRANMVARPDDWSWSSYRAVIGKAPAPPRLAVEPLLDEFGSDRTCAPEQHRALVLAGVGVDVWAGLRQQIYLGDEQNVGQGRDAVRASPYPLGVLMMMPTFACATLGPMAR